jgi:hypothetical protein
MNKQACWMIIHACIPSKHPVYLHFMEAGKNNVKIFIENQHLAKMR